MSQLYSRCAKVALFALVMFGLLSPTWSARSDDSLSDIRSEAMTLARAVEARLTVWKTPNGKVVHVRHCRDAREGCRARIATFARWIVRIAKKWNIDPFTLAAIAMRESGFNPAARGGAGERGIVQLHPLGVGRRVHYVRSEAYRARCAKTPGVCQREVLEVGAQHVSEAIERCGSLAAGLGAYNSGHCGETDYSRRVLEERARLLTLAKRGTEAADGV